MFTYRLSDGLWNRTISPTHKGLPSIHGHFTFLDLISNSYLLVTCPSQQQRLDKSIFTMDWFHRRTASSSLQQFFSQPRNCLLLSSIYDLASLRLTRKNRYALPRSGCRFRSKTL